MKKKQDKLIDVLHLRGSGRKDNLKFRVLGRIRTHDLQFDALPIEL